MKHVHVEGREIVVVTERAGQAIARALDGSD